MNKISREEMIKVTTATMNENPYIDSLSKRYRKRVYRAILAALDGPSEEERREMWHWIESWRNLCQAGMVHGCDKCKLTENGQPSKSSCNRYRDKIRNLIAGNPAPEKKG